MRIRRQKEGEPRVLTRSKGTTAGLAWHHSGLFCTTWTMETFHRSQDSVYSVKYGYVFLIVLNCMHIVHVVYNIKLYCEWGYNIWQKMSCFCYFLHLYQKQLVVAAWNNVDGVTLTSRLCWLSRPWSEKKVPTCLSMLESIFDQVLEVIQFIVVCRHYKPFKADSWAFDVKTCPLANIQCIGNTAKLSKIYFYFMHFHPLPNDKQGEGDAFKDLWRCADVMSNWLRFGFKSNSSQSQTARFKVSCEDPTE